MVRAKYKGGSQLLLKKPKDIDYIYFVDTLEEKFALNDELNNDKKKNEDFSIRLVENATKMTSFSYLYPLMILVKGEEIEALKNYDFLGKKEEYVAYVKERVKRMRKESKQWYHIYIAICMFENNKMELTDEQVNIAQQIHDEGANDELYKYIIEYLEKTK